MTIKRLTENQAKTLEKIKAAMAATRRRTEADIRQAFPNMTMVYDGVEKPITISEWMPYYHLCEVFRVNRGTLNQLIRKGYILKRDTDGFGPEVKPA